MKDFTVQFDSKSGLEIRKGSLMIILPSDLLNWLICIPFGIASYLYVAYLLKIKELLEVYGIAQPFINRLS